MQGSNRTCREYNLFLIDYLYAKGLILKEIKVYKRRLSLNIGS